MAHTVERFEFGAADGGQPASYCGVHIDNGGARPRVSLFEIAENDGANVQSNILQAALAVRNKHLPGHRMDAIDWTLTHLMWHSAVEFTEQNGLVTGIHLPHGMLLSAPIRQSIKDYEAKMEDGRYLDTDGFIKTSPITTHPVYVPDHAGKCVFAKRAYTSGALEGQYESVLADSQKLAHIWKAQTIPLERQLRQLKTSWDEVTKQSWASGYDAILHNLPKEQNIGHIWGTSFKDQIEMPYVHFNPDRETPFAFSNGRHRLWNAISAGAPYVALEMCSGRDTDIFKSIAGWKPESVPAVDTAIPLAYPKYAR